MDGKMAFWPHLPQSTSLEPISSAYTLFAVMVMSLSELSILAGAGSDRVRGVPAVVVVVWIGNGCPTRDAAEAILGAIATGTGTGILATVGIVTLSASGLPYSGG